MKTISDPFNTEPDARLISEIQRLERKVNSLSRKVRQLENEAA